MVEVSTAWKLQNAIDKKQTEIIITGRLAKVLATVHRKKEKNPTLSDYNAENVTAVVGTTAAIVLRIVTIIEIFKHYTTQVELNGQRVRLNYHEI